MNKGLSNDHTGECLNSPGLNLCVSYLLLGIYDRLPTHLSVHVANCLRCRKLVVSVFARRLLDLSKYMSPVAIAEHVTGLHGSAPKYTEDTMPDIN
ncbi:MAG: hypothetical protein WB699_10270 [Bacteroidota bacterium]